jgi:OHCU decarboxylase
VESALQWRPFSSVDAFHAKLVDVLALASEDDKLALIRAHPDLVGAAAIRGSLTPHSTAEQREAGLGVDDLSENERIRFAELNETYQEEFGFPFVICVRENRKRTIVEAFGARLVHDRDLEIRTAIDEINKIARYRLLDVIDV